MKISLNWLKDYIKTDLSTDEIATWLTAIGLEVEGSATYEQIKGGLRGLVIGHVKTREKHPNADKLSCTTVDVGTGTDLHIVCGAPNVAAGQKVIVATEGATLYPTSGESFTIKKGKIRGEVSEGMICAEDEIGLGQSHDGILVLDANAPVGMPAAEFLQLASDTVLEINLTPNRSDATGHLGVAFDLAAALSVNNKNASFQKPTFSAKASTQSPLAVEIRDAVRCARYAGVSISGLTVADSPAWLQNRLKAIGVNPINNVVDATNYVLHELGQPLHAFELSAIGGGKVVVQTLPEGTKFRTLDGETRTLSAEDLMICDGNDAPMCIAGVFGGQDSGVKPTTTAIFLESAHFAATSVRRTSMRHQLRTDAATRFEKGTDINQVRFALERAAALIVELAGGEISSAVVDVYPQPVARKRISIKYAHVQRLIGAQLPKDEIQRILSALDMDILHETDHDLLVSVPTNKVDVLREADVIEEILRIYGYNRIEMPATLQSVLSFAEKPNPQRVKNLLADMLAAQGFSEMMAVSLTNSRYFAEIAPIDAGKLVFVNNTSNQNLDVMRPTMLFSGLEAILHNQNRQSSSLKLFEFGKTYLKTESGKYAESQRLSVFLTGERLPANWLHKSGQATSFYTLKSVVETIFQRLGIGGFQQSVVENEGDFAYALRFQRGKQVLASFGQVSPRIAKAMDIKQPVFYADLDWDALTQAVKKHKIQYQALPKFPAVRRDLAMILDQKIAFAQVQDIAQRQGKKLLKEVNLFDVYEDPKHVGEGKKSYAVSFVFQDEEKTLRDSDIDGAMQALMRGFEQQLQAIIRK